MKVGIIGAGRIGSALARLLVKAGYLVAVSNSRGPESLQDLVKELGERATPMSAEDAARYGDVVILAVPWRAYDALPKPEFVAGKIVIDVMNPYREDMGLYDLGDSSSSEVVQMQLPGARVVKAFNTIHYHHLAIYSHPDLPIKDRHAIFVASDDSEAKAVVLRLIEEIGFAPVNTGSLREGGRKQGPGTALYNHPMTARQAQDILKQAASDEYSFGGGNGV
jgi:predicted dinucleotide-binding enzyme